MSTVRRSDRRAGLAVCIALCALAGAVPAEAAPGGLDSSFGVGGKVVTDFTGQPGDGAFDVAVQDDGRIVVAGQSFEEDATEPDEFFNTFHNNFALVRYNRDGTLDTTFGADGRVSTDFAGKSDVASAVAVRPDGKIVVAGTTAVTLYLGGYAMDSDFAVDRYNADGTLDTTFGGDGKVTTSLGGSPWSVDRALAVGIEADGGIVAAGQAQTGSRVAVGLVRYRQDGTLDSDFGDDGRVTTEVSEHGAAGAALAIQADGRIVVAGGAYHQEAPDAPSSSDFAVVRYKRDGALDDTFGTGGTVTTDLGGSEAAASVAIQPDGRIVAGGPALVRYDVHGALDPSFGSGGIVALAGPGGAADVAVQTDGKIVAAVSLFLPNAIRFGLIRRNADGTPDSDFGSRGEVDIDFGEVLQIARAVAIQPDGRIVVAGFTAECGCHIAPIDIAAARFKASGSWEYDPPGRRPNQCLTESARDLNAVFGVQDQIVCHGTITAGGHWRPATYWFVNEAYDTAPPGYVPAAPTPLADLVAKLQAVKVLIDAGTGQQRTFVFAPGDALRTDVTLDQISPEDGYAPMAVSIPRVKPLSVGEHTVEVRWVLSAMHCDGFGASEAYNCLPAGEARFGRRRLTVTRSSP